MSQSSFFVVIKGNFESDQELQDHFDEEVIFPMIGIKKFLTESPAARAVIASVTRGYPAVMVSNFSASHGAFRGQLQ